MGRGQTRQLHTQLVSLREGLRIRVRGRKRAAGGYDSRMMVMSMIATCERELQVGIKTSKAPTARVARRADRSRRTALFMAWHGLAWMAAAERLAGRPGGLEIA